MHINTSFLGEPHNLFDYSLFGIYVIELGTFFKGVFTNVKITPNSDPITSQVFFGTPREAYKSMIETFNGVVKLPMINYHISAMQRLPQFEKSMIYMSAPPKDSTTKNGSIMKFPSIFEVKFQVDIWNNNIRERDYFLHKLINKFPMNSTSVLFYRPDPANYPNLRVPMHFRMENDIVDESSWDEIEIKETRDRIRTTLTLTCERAFVPYEIYEVPMIEFVTFQSLINEKMNNETTADYEATHKFAPLEENLIEVTTAIAAVI